MNITLQFFLFIFFFALTIWPLKFLISTFRNDNNATLTISSTLVIIYLLIGIFFSTTFFWANPANHLVDMQIWFSVVYFILQGIVLAKYVKNTKWQKIVNILFAIYFGVLFFSKLFLLTDIAIDYEVNFKDVYQYLHIDLFSLVFLGIMVRPLINAKCKSTNFRNMFDNFIIVFGVFAACLYTINNSGGDVSLIELRKYETTLNYFALFSFVIYMVLTKQVTINLRSMYLNYYWIAIFSVILIFVEGFMLFNLVPLNSGNIFNGYPHIINEMAGLKRVIQASLWDNVSYTNNKFYVNSTTFMFPIASESVAISSVGYYVSIPLMYYFYLGLIIGSITVAITIFLWLVQKYWKDERLSDNLFAVTSNR